MRGKKPATAPFGDDDVINLPSAVDRIPEAPWTLKGKARKLWPLVVGELVVRNIYASDCQDVVEAYCVQRARWLAAEDDILARGQLLLSHSQLSRNPSLKISNDACDRMNRLAQELGLTPVARKRVVKVRGAGSQAPAAKFLKQA